MNGYYILGPGHVILPCISLLQWAAWMEKSDRHVARTEFDIGVIVSTVFLGLDHSFRDNGPPILFETMVFSDASDFEDLQCIRYATWEEAEAGHEQMCNKVREWIERAQQTMPPTLDK